MEDFAIRVDDVSKTFRLPHEKNSSVKSAVVNFTRRKKGFEIQKALNDISFDIKKGEFFGIVGRNGSGKSTLLKLLAGIYEPSEGQIHVRGSLTPFIELGVGFNPELTGRENVYLNGALLGFNRKEMKAMYQDIVSFAELGKFMDQKLKNYSSGMQVRLAFSIAIRAQSDILLLDQVLAVGDEAFQQKCIDIFEQYKASHKTIVLVSHDMEMIKRFCSKAVLINNGDLVLEGSPQKVTDEYIRLNQEAIKKEIASSRRGNSGALKLQVKDSKGQTRTTFDTSEEMIVTMTWPKNLKGILNAGVAIHKNSGEYIFGDNTFGKHPKIGGGKIEYSVKLDLGPGKYHIVAGLFGESHRDIVDFLYYGPEFMINKDSDDETEGVARLKSRWDYE